MVVPNDARRKSESYKYQLPAQTWLKPTKQVPVPPVIFTTTATSSRGPDLSLWRSKPYLGVYQGRVKESSIIRPNTQAQRPIAQTTPMLSPAGQLSHRRALSLAQLVASSPSVHGNTSLVRKTPIEEDEAPTELESSSRESSVVSSSADETETETVFERPNKTAISRDQVRFSRSLEPLQRLTDNTTLISKFRKMLASFPHFKHPDQSVQLDYMRNFKFTITRDSWIVDHLKKTIPQRNWDSEGIFFFPGCIHKTMTGAQHFLAFGPLHQEIPGFKSESNENHIIRSRFEHFYGITRELFVNRNNGIVYAGRYKMHSLHGLAPEGLEIPAHAALKEIATAALPAFPPKGFPTYEQLCALYQSGTLRVECVALQMVDYDENIHHDLKGAQMEKAPPKPMRKGKVKEGRIEKRSRPREARGLKREKVIILG